MKPMPEKAPSFLALVLTALRESGLAMVLTFALTQSASTGPNIDCHYLIHGSRETRGDSILQPYLI